jgi:hypothetical protein
MGAIYNIEIREGQKVAMLFTPRLYAFKGTEGVTFEQEGADMLAVYALYADVMFCAALNHWTLTHPADEEFPYNRVDFHEYSVTHRKSFEKAVIFAMEALSGKSVRELMENAKKTAETAKESASDAKVEEDVKKKGLRGWITSLLRRFS